MGEHEHQRHWRGCCRERDQQHSGTAQPASTARETEPYLAPGASKTLGLPVTLRFNCCNALGSCRSVVWGHLDAKLLSLVGQGCSQEGLAPFLDLQVSSARKRVRISCACMTSPSRFTAV